MFTEGKLGADGTAKLTSAFQNGFNIAVLAG